MSRLSHSELEKLTEYTGLLAEMRVDLTELKSELEHFEGMRETPATQSWIADRAQRIERLEDQIFDYKLHQDEIFAKLSVRHKVVEQNIAKNDQPPILAEAVTRWVTKPDLVDMVLDSRAERYALDRDKRGTGRAKLLYWIDTMKSCWPGIVSLVRWALAGEMFRRWLGS